MARRRHALLTPLTAVILSHHARQPASAERTLSIPASLRDDVAAYLPACAVPCLASFIAANYARGDDTDQYLTLDFVCAHRGRSGYTVAEGALQCLTAERSVGFCDDGTIDVKVNQICSGRKDVAKNKGGAMTATLRYASQSGVLTFAPITTSLSAVPIPTPMETSTTSTSSSTSSFSETTLMTATSTRSSSTITTTTPLSSQTSTSSPTSTPEAPAADTSSPPPFSKGQIAGITIGAICLAAGVAFGLILLVRFLLRRRRRHSGSTIGSFIGGGPPGGGGGGGGGHAGYMTARDTWGYGFDKTSNSNGSSSASWATREAPGMSRYPAMPAAAMAMATASNSSSSSSGGGHTKQQQRQQQLHHHHQPYNRESWRPSAIGLAISPSKLFASRRTPTPTSTPTRPRPLSKLLPAKPDMTPANAIRTGLSPPPPPPPAATYQETRGAQASQQQSFLHPIAAQFMRPSAATAAAATRPTSLRLVIPDSQPLPPPPPPPVPEKELHLQRQPILGRESTLTEFEEDDLHRSASTAVGQIWRPPSLLPDSSAVAAPYYVADGSGNWVLGDARKSMMAGAGASGKETMRPQSPEPESAVSAPRIATARSGIMTTAVQTHIMAPRRSPAMLTPRDETARATMDKYTQQQQQQQHGNNEPQELEASPSPPLPLSRDKQRSAKQETTQLGAATPAPPKTPRIRSIVHTPKTVPSPLFSRQPNPRSASQPLPTTSEGRLFTVRPAPSRVMSDDSGITTFSVSSATSDDMPPPLPAPSNRNLSPVAESPRVRVASRAAVQELGNSNAAVHELAAPVAAASNHSRSSSNGGGGGGGTGSALYPPRITGRSTPAPHDHAVLPGSALSPPPPRMALLSNQPSASQSSPTLGSVTRPHQGHANAASFQRQPPLPSSPYHGAPEAARGGMAWGRGRGGSMMTMMRPPPSDMPLDPTLLAPPQVPQHPRTGSPTMRIVEPSPEPNPAHPTITTTTTTAPTRDDRSLLPSAAITTRPPRRRPPSHLPHPFPMYPLRRNPPPSQQRQQQQQPDSAPPPCAAPYPTSPPPPSSSSPRRRRDNNDNDSSSSSSLSRYPGYPMPIPQPYKPRAAPSPSPRAAPFLRSDYDPAAHDNSSQEALADASSSSSLLAKRLGSTRAADMALPTQSNRDRERRWQQVPQQPQQPQQQQQQAGEGRMQKRTQDTEYLATPELPSTPTWVPRLTPTRRGEDLVLNVG
ncbi:hypothetical protein BBO_06783 [Beauveria brongniartii RCEF 3172]|uniref:Uncharacterized protein n=1 Tax=Beauveria brongniartii RCEF 3172 TaxID=1081107 RepID=A0A167AHV9_9HYPO|nr:hypothetical protein BBO_06783 [Beauveria brongniartii RCEF 3172]